jgi:uncharacterized cupredoxin-like copper-binding protein
MDTKRIYVALAALAVASIGSSCGSDANDASVGGNSGARAKGVAVSNDIAGSVKEWKVQVDPTISRAGDVTFTIDNLGTIGHEFLIVKTDIPPGEIPVEGDHFPEEAEGIEVIDEIGEFDAGTTETLSVTLERGSYQLVCNLPGHYAKGMFLGFDVVT